MILYDKPYIKTPKNNVSLMHYLGLTQFISILESKSLIFSTSLLYQDKREGFITIPSHEATLKNVLWEDNTPLRKDDHFFDYKKIYEPYKNDENGVWDSFAYLIINMVRYFMFMHCWSLSDEENILMWDRYKFHKPALGIKTTIERIGNAIETERVYIGEINYVDHQKEHIVGYEGFSEKNLTDKETIEELFYQPFFHKQKCYKSENEVRLIISYEDITKSLTGETYITDIPYYDESFGFEQNYPRNYPNDRPFDDPYIPPHKFFANRNKKYAKIPPQIPVKVDTDELIEEIIISPYAESYDLNVVRSIAEKYEFDSNRIVNSPIDIKT